MKYIVLDMEWNQTYGHERQLPFGRTLTGEVIEIGAVRLDDDFNIEEYFKIYVKPKFYTKLHSMVKRLTGIGNDTLRDAPYFPEAVERFKDFCTDEFITLTWGDSDIPILRENIDAHHLEKWTAKNYNLQSIYMKENDLKNCVSLESAAAALGIDSEDVTFHDAACDAAVTAQIAQRIDTAGGIASYRVPIAELSDADILSYETVGGVANMQKLRADPRIRFTRCPECLVPMEAKRIIPQGSGKKISCLECAEHGKYLLKLRTLHAKDGSFTVTKTLYVWSDDVGALFDEKMKIAERKKEKFLARVRGKKRKSRGKKNKENETTKSDPQ